MTSQPYDAPTRVGSYTLLTRLGEGGMGVVHLARGADGRRVALKVLRDHIVGDAEARARLAREVGSLSRVRSPWVAEILAADPWGATPYVVTRYVPGLSLHDHVNEEGPVTDRDLYWLAGCLAEGIDAVHAAGVLHRDVKPANVLMEGRTPILIDFGLARVADDPRLTQTGWLLGTPGYLAPEILYGDDPTPAADVHAWAATVAYAATGRSPYGRGPAMAIMDRARRGEHDLSGIGSPLADVLDRALQPDPLERPLLEELLAWLRPLSTRPTDPPAPPPTGGVLGSAAVAPYDDFTLPLALAAQAGAAPALDAMPTPTTTPTPETLAAPGDAEDQRATVAEHPTLREPEGRTRMLAADPTVPPSAAAPAAPTPPAAPAAPTPPAGQPGLSGQPDALARMESAWDQQYGLAAPSPVPAGERIRRGVAVVAGAFALGGALAAAPWVCLIAVVVVVWLLRAGSLASSAVADRRQLRGPKWHDAPRWLVTGPWHTLRAITGTVVLVGWSAGLALAAGLLCYAFALDLPTTLLVSGTTFGVALWSGPGSSRFRSPVSRVLYPCVRRPLGWLAVCAVLVGAGALLVIVALGQGPAWTPASGAPFGIG